MNYRQSRNYENLQRRIYNGVGEYDIPKIKREKYCGCEWISFNYAKSCKNKKGKGLHFFIDDYQFNRLWTDIDRYVPFKEKLLQLFRDYAGSNEEKVIMRTKKVKL